MRGVIFLIRKCTPESISRKSRDHIHDVMSRPYYQEVPSVQVSNW